MATNSQDLASMFDENAPEDQMVVDSRILIPELEEATLRVLDITFTDPEARSYNEKSYMTSQMGVTFEVDDEEARAVTFQDSPRLFHYVRVNLKEGVDGVWRFDWSNNIDLVKLFIALGVKVYEGTGKNRKYVGNRGLWAAEAVNGNYCIKGKIVHEPVKAKDPETGDWTAFKMEADGETPVLKAVLSAFASA